MYRDIHLEVPCTVSHCSMNGHQVIPEHTLVQIPEHTLVQIGILAFKVLFQKRYFEMQKNVHCCVLQKRLFGQDIYD